MERRGAEQREGRRGRGGPQWLPLSTEYSSKITIWNFRPEGRVKMTAMFCYFVSQGVSDIDTLHIYVPLNVYTSNDDVPSAESPRWPQGSVGRDYKGQVLRF